MLNASAHLTRVERLVRETACTFAADVRERLEAVALAHGGARWARRLGEMWWYTEFSEKNTEGGTRPWWELARVEAIRARLDEVQYGWCLYVGDVDVAGVVRQLGSQMGVAVRVRSVSSRHVSLRRVLLLRAIALLALVGIAVLARLTPPRLSAPASLERSRTKAFLFTYFPRSWIATREAYYDRYHARVDEAVEQLGLDPVFVLALPDHLNPVEIRMAWRRFRLLRRRGTSVPRVPQYVLLEAYASIRRVVVSCLSLGDLWRYRGMRSQPDFTEAFDWRGLNIASLVSPRILRSIAIDWPHAEMLQSCTERLSLDHVPAASWLHFFEYIGGRAMIAGLNAAGKGRVIAVQHGLITPNRLSYAGDPRERKSSPLGAAGVPEPDLYALESDLAREIVEATGVPGARTAVTGAPRREHIWRLAERSRRIDRFSERLVRVLVGFGQHDIPSMWGHIKEGIVPDASLRLILKFHPNTPPDQIPSVASGEGGAEVRWIGNDVDIYDAMSEADIAVGSSSSTLLEAMAFGLPVVMVSPHRTLDLNRFWSDGDVLEAGNGAELRGHIRRLAEDRAFREGYVERLQEVVARAFGPADGHASERLAAAGLDAARTR